MKKLTIEDVSKIIFDVKEQYKINDKNFEIFALAAVLDELKMEDFYNLSILRTSSDKYEEQYSCQILFPTNSGTFGRYDSEEKKFVAITDRNGNKHNAHAIHTEKELSLLKDIYNLFENNTNFADFRKEFENKLSPKINDDFIATLENLYHKSYDFSKLMFVKHLNLLKNIDNLTDRGDKIDLGLSLFRSALSQLASVKESDYSPEDGIHTAVSEGSFDDKLHSNMFESVIKYDNLTGASIGNYLTDDDIVKVKHLLDTDYVKNNTVSGIVMSDNILSEKIFKLVGYFYEELRDDFIETLENVTLLKSREQMAANFHIDEIKAKILEAFPTAFNEKDLKAVKSVIVEEFSNDTAESGRRYFEYLRSLKPFGLIRGVDLINNSHFNLNHDAFFEDYSRGKLVTLKSVNEVETLYQYTMKEYDVYGVKLLEAKDVYMSKELGHAGFNDSVDDLINYAKANNCILVTSDRIDDRILFGDFENHLITYGYENVVFYDRDQYNDKEHLNMTLGLQKEMGAKMVFDDHIKIKEFINSKRYVDPDELMDKAKDIINSKKVKKSKINGPS